MKQQQRLLIANLLRVVINHVVGMAVGEDEIDGAIVVVVEKLQSPAAQQASGLRYAVKMRGIAEAFVLSVDV